MPKRKGKKDQPVDQTLRDSVELVCAFAKQNIDGVLLINEDATIVEWNHVMEEISGLNSEEAIGMKAWDIQILLIPENNCSEEAYARYKYIFCEMIRTGVIPERIASNESSIYRKDGKLVYAEQKLFSIKTDTGNWIGAVVRDMIERRKTEQQIRQQAARAEALAACSQLLTQAHQDFQLVLETVVQRCAELIGDGASIFLYSSKNDTLELAAVYNPTPEAIEIFRLEMQRLLIRVDEGAYGQVIETRQPVLIPQIPIDELIENASTERRDYYKKLPLYSMMLAPLQVQGELLGIIGLGRHTPGKDYSHEDLTFLQDIADRAALAMLNAHLYRELEQELAEREALIAELEQKNAELERCTYTVSHDLNSPLITINGFLGHLEENIAS